MCIYSRNIHVRLQDIDAAGILFFAQVFEYCHDTYFALLADRGIDLPHELAHGAHIMPLVHCEADFKSPMRFGDAVTVAITGASAGKSSYRVHYRITGTGDPVDVRCTATAIHAVVDRQTFRSAPRIPDLIYEALEIPTPPTPKTATIRQSRHASTPREPMPFPLGTHFFVTSVTKANVHF